MKAGLGIAETDTWYMIETIAGKNNIGYKHIVSCIICTSKRPYFVCYVCLWLKRVHGSSIYLIHFAVEKLHG